MQRLASIFIILYMAELTTVFGQLSNQNDWGGNEHLVGNSKAAVLCNQGIDLLARGYNATARKYFDAAIESDRGSYLLYWNRAMYFRETHQWSLALTDLNSCLRLKRTYVPAFVMRGAINDRLGNYRDALADYNGVVKISPHDRWMLDCRASLLATCPDASVRNGQAAVQDAMAACKMDNFDRAQFIDTLAAAYAETGDFDSATRYEEKAMAQAHKSKEYTAGMEKRLALYQRHKPYREPAGTVRTDLSKSSKPKTD